jgi:V/A-type H+-transporting ATPase subunit F
VSFFVIGDEDTVLGFKLVGIRGVRAARPEEVRDAFREAISDSSVRILLITERLARKVEGALVRHRASRRTPYVVEIPDRHGPLSTRKPIPEMIREAIGIRV